MNKPKGYIYGARWAERTIEARACRVILDAAPKDWWCHGMVGTERAALEVKIDGQTVYIDNEDGKALAACLNGLLPLPGTRFMPVFMVMNDEAGRVFYKAKPDGSR